MASLRPAVVAFLAIFAFTPAHAADHGQSNKNKEEDVAAIGHRKVDGRVNFFTIQREMALGRELSREVEKQARIVTDPVITGYIDRLGQKLAANSDVTIPVTFQVIDSNDIGAFTLPGGHVYINAGFVRLTSNEAELASALAREIGHAAARHATREATRTTLLNLGTLPLMFAGGWGGVAASSAARLVAPLAFRGVSRGFETEADLLGLEYMWSAGYDPEAGIDLFETLESTEHRHAGSLAGLFREHPRTRDRVEKMQENINRLLPARSEYVLNTAEYEEVRARLFKPELGAEPASELSSDQPVLRNRSDGVN